LPASLALKALKVYVLRPRCRIASSTSDSKALLTGSGAFRAIATRLRATLDRPIVDSQDMLRVATFVQQGYPDCQARFQDEQTHTRRGYATEAARAMLTYGFDSLGSHRIWAECNADNAASAHVLEKLGMRREAHFREHDYFKDRWWDTLIYAMLDREWRAAPGTGTP
jgi:RimJ/RimL family protein N-acetyltransferase